jgi:hypothetical protein
MKLLNNKTIDTIIQIVAFWSAIIVASVTFIRSAWVSNDMTEKTRNFILWMMVVLDNFVIFVRNELTPVPVAKVSTKSPKRSKSVVS